MRAGLAILLLGAFVHGSSGASTLYQQPRIGAGQTGETNNRTSHKGAWGGSFINYDNLALPAGDAIGGVMWNGFFADYLTVANNPTPPNVLSWEVKFWGDAGGTPGALLQTYPLSLAQVQTQFVRILNVSTPAYGSVDEYRFASNLAPPLAASAGQTYWLSIQALTTAENPLWAWLAGTPGDGTAIQEDADTLMRTVVNRDRAFELFDTSGIPDADFTENGVVDGADLGRWQSGFGISAAATHMQGDANGDLTVDGSDFLIWQQQLGTVSTPPGLVSVPEPRAPLILLATAWVGGIVTLPQRPRHFTANNCRL